MRDCTIVTSCCGRLPFLQQALPSWLYDAPSPIVVVDYSCPDGSGDWAESVGAWVVRVHGRKFFSRAAALNAGIAAVDTRFTLVCDADTVWKPGLSAAVSQNLSPGSMTIVEPAAGQRDLNGFLVAETAALQKTPYDEGYVGWGFEDIDLRLELYAAGVRTVHLLPASLLEPLPHSDEIRTAHFEERDLLRSSSAGFRHLAAKYLARTGRSIAAPPCDPVEALLVGRVA